MKVWLPFAVVMIFVVLAAVTIQAYSPAEKTDKKIIDWDSKRNQPKNFFFEKEPLAASNLISAVETGSSELDLKKEEKADGLEYNIYKQTYKGIPVYKGKVSYVSKGSLVFVDNDFYPDINTETSYRIQRENLFNLVGKYMDAELAILPIENEESFEYKLAWKVELPTNPETHEQFTVFVGANTGEILEKINNIMDLTGRATGKVFPEYPSQQRQSANFSNQSVYLGYLNKVLYSGKGNNLNNYVQTPVINISGSQPQLKYKIKYTIESGWDYLYVEISKDNLTWSNLKTYTGSFDWKNEIVNLTGYNGSVQIRFRYKTDPSVIMEGAYLDDIEVLSGGPSAGTTVFSATDDFSSMTLSGFQVKDDVTLTDAIITDSSGTYQTEDPKYKKVTARLEGPYVKVFNNAQAEAAFSSDANGSTADINWASADMSYLQEESNLFYHANIIHDYFTSGTPFNITAMNYQMPAYVQDFGSCNAYYDLSEQSINFGRQSSSCNSTALSSDVIYHEYTHAVIDHMYDLGLGCFSEGGAMHEGLADYFAGTINNNSFIVEEVIKKPYLRNLKNTKKYPTNYSGECHTGGEIFGGAHWDLRELIGKEQTDRLVMLALKAEPQTFASYLNIMIMVDDDNSNLLDGTPHLAEICSAFGSNHGINSTLCKYISVEKADILLVDDGGDKDTYTTALDGLGLIYSVWNHSISPPKDMLLNFSTVIWSTGNKTDTLSAEEQDVLKGYLDNGGQLFLSGYGIGADIGNTTFHKDYLGSEYSGYTLLTDMAGYPGTLFDGLKFYQLHNGKSSVLLPMNQADELVSAVKTFTVSYNTSIPERCNDPALSAWFGNSIIYPDYGTSFSIFNAGGSPENPNPWGNYTNATLLLHENLKLNNGNVSIDLENFTEAVYSWSLSSAIPGRYLIPVIFSTKNQSCSFIEELTVVGQKGTMATQYDSGKYKVVYLSFDLEDNTNSYSTKEVIDRSLKWLNDSIIVNSPKNITYLTNNITVDIDTVTSADNVYVELDKRFGFWLGSGKNYTVNLTSEYLYDGNHILDIISDKGFVKTKKRIQFAVDTFPPDAKIKYSGYGDNGITYINGKNLKIYYGDTSDVNTTSLKLSVDGVVVKNSTYNNFVNFTEEIFYGPYGVQSENNRKVLEYIPETELPDGLHIADIEIEDVWGHKANYTLNFVKDTVVPIIQNVTIEPRIFGPKTSQIKLYSLINDTNLLGYAYIIARGGGSLYGPEGALMSFINFTNQQTVSKELFWKPTAYNITDLNNTLEVVQTVLGTGNFTVSGYMEVNYSDYPYKYPMPAPMQPPQEQPTKTEPQKIQIKNFFLDDGPKEEPSKPMPAPSEPPTSVPGGGSGSEPGKSPAPYKLIVSVTATFNLTTGELIGFDRENVSVFFADNRKGDYMPFNASKLKLVERPIETATLAVFIAAADKAGNGNYIILPLISDATPPIINLVNKTEANNTVSVIVKIIDNVELDKSWLEAKKLYSNKTYTFNFSNKSNISIFEALINTSNLDDGQYILSVKAEDSVGNMGTKTIGPLYIFKAPKSDGGGGSGNNVKRTFENQSVYIPQEKFKLDMKNETNLALELKLKDNATGSLNVIEFKQNPGVKELAKAFGYKEIIVDQNITDKLDFVQMKFFYTDSDLSDAGIAESTLKPYYFNETSGAWELMANYTVNTTEKSVSFNSTHFSLYSLSGDAPVIDAPAPVLSSGGGGGSGPSTPAKKIINTTQNIQPKQEESNKAIENKTSTTPENPVKEEPKSEVKEQPKTSDGITGLVTGANNTGTLIAGAIIVVVLTGLYLFTKRKKAK